MSQDTATVPRAAGLVPVSGISSVSRAKGMMTERDMSACNSLLLLVLGPFPARSPSASSAAQDWLLACWLPSSGCSLFSVRLLPPRKDAV